MSDFKIIGNPNPVVGVLEFYTVSDFFSEISPTQEFVYIPNSPENQVKWEVYVLEFGKWRKTKENDKTGKQITYTFFEKSLTRKGIRLLARKGEKVARLDIKPLPAHPKIDHIELLDKNGSKITERLAYGQTVKARVFCLNMEKRRVHVTLWEDDVKGAGHSKANEKNFIETRSAIVNFGKADIDFLLKPSFAKIATKGGSENDKIHEYYVTAEYDREKTASNNVNVNAPETPIAPYKGKTTAMVPSVNNKTVSQPKKELPKSDKTAAPAAPKGKVNRVNVTDTSGHAIKGIFREKQIKVWINSSNLIGKDVRLKLFDDDYGKDDLLLHKEFTILSDLHAIVVPLDTIPRSWGGNFLAEGNEQELFAEVEVLQTHAFTKSTIVDVDAIVFKQDPFEIFNKVLKVDMPDKKEKKEENCVCKDYDLVWGNKVSCEFRKKVIEIAKRLGKDPNLLMAGMALETGKTFFPTAGQGTSYVGLIQFGDSAAESVGTTRSALLKMTAIQQLDYIEKYLEKKKDKINTLTDFYLSILMPVDVGKGNQPNAVVFDNEFPLAYKKDGVTLTDLSKSRHFGYRQNRSFLYEEGESEIVRKGGGKKYDGAGKTYVWEIEKHISYIYNQGKTNKAHVFLCDKDNVSKSETESGTWNVIVTEKYTEKKCSHEKARNNCRRGTIEVFDHNQKSVLTISDCLLEGWKGEDRMKTDNDTPFGIYQINSTPFIMGSSTGDNRLKYGPNPRLAFEPIKGSGDEADKSKRSAIRIHGGRQEDSKTYVTMSNAVLKRSSGCVRIYDSDAKNLYDWWVEFHKLNPQIKPGKVTIRK